MLRNPMYIKPVAMAKRLELPVAAAWLLAPLAP
jgi:hypothetical protein